MIYILCAHLKRWVGCMLTYTHTKCSAFLNNGLMVCMSVLAMHLLRQAVPADGFGHLVQSRKLHAKWGKLPSGWALGGGKVAAGP